MVPGGSAFKSSLGVGSGDGPKGTGVGAVGCSVGAAVGISVGCREGPGEGCGEGCSEGSAEGFAEGTAVGADGSDEGTAVGVGERAAETREGATVGAYVPKNTTFITGADTEIIIGPLSGTIIPCAAAFAVIELDNAPLAAAVVSLFCNAAKASLGFPVTVT